jgi:uncharacterized sulfatase
MYVRLSIAILACVLASFAHAADRPNVLWLSCEDLSPHHISCYGGQHAITPHIDALARRGVRFTRAFTNAGVCAPSRTGIITAVMPTSLGANHMRSKATLPDFVKGFPYYLRQDGYYCTNNVKTDYNLADFDAGWHEVSNRAHWRNRPSKDQPFFAVFNWVGTHESQVFAGPDQHEKLVARLTPAERQDADRLFLPPIYPDTPKVRRDQADYHELTTVLDHWLGDRLAELEADGLLDDTIVFFWSDHGDGLPRAKRWLYDSGTHIPLIVSIPEIYRQSGQGRPGTVDDQLVSGIDFGPTVLNLAGVPVPPHMQGRAFLGPDLSPPREYVHGARDRMDERYDLIRSVRDKRFRYVRNYMPWKPYDQPVAYGEQQATMQELRRLAAAGELPENCRWFSGVPKPIEELYDLDDDHWEQHNLAADPAYSQVLERLRGEHDAWVLQTRDVHLLPEPMLSDDEARLGSRWAIFRGDEGLARLRRIQKATASAGAADLNDEDEAVRYWAVQRLGFAGETTSLAPMLRDPSPTVRVTAAGWLGRSGQAERALPVLIAELNNVNTWVVTAALTALDEMGESARPALPHLDKIADKDVEYPSRLIQHLREGLQPRSN